jgi:outer membrane protein TolC
MLPYPRLKANCLRPPLDAWWTGFADPESTKIVERALAQNLDLAASVARIEQARAIVKEAGAKRTPNIDLQANDLSLRQLLQSPVGRYGSAFPGYDRNQSYFDLGIGATWETDIFGSLKRGAEVANAEAQAAEAEHLGTRVLIAAEAADAYVQIRGARVRIAFANEQISNDEHLLQLVRRRRMQESGLIVSLRRQKLCWRRQKHRFRHSIRFSTHNSIGLMY